ncbi:TadE/TadG family type IV pilus assembly protein [Aureimonas mangrovi]|uniref:TadE/TadG family type IV pilus assembly protein n=1 Tax=Aureimonas mangrovi TaxID=2758041 RepID=UPI00163D4730|nr:TadE/TadG family type IV pilus assembly protein [Aureimonas mangrovi]
MAAGLIRRFIENRKASIPVMTAVLLMPMIVISGGAIDLIAHERMRSKLQDGLDRGVLAAASLAQTQPTRETIESYLRTVAPEGSYQLQFTEERYTNSRTVEATLESSIDTVFLSLIGIDSIAANARSKAQEERSNIEISLLLDVSGSMRWGSSNSFAGIGRMRIDALRPAANGFLDVVLNDESREYTTVNVIPYAGQVSVGPVIFDALMGGRRTHSRSSCFEFLESDFTLSVPDFSQRHQTQHFTQANHHTKLNTQERTITQPWWCPDDPHEAMASNQPDYVPNEGRDTDVTSISLMSNRRDALKTRIDNYKLYDGTGTPIAMKYGLLLLDPAIQPMIAQASRYPPMANALGLDPKFANRPARFEDRDTRKFIVLMTDGEISSQRKPKEEGAIQYYSDGNRNRDVFNAGRAVALTQQLCDAAKNKGVTIFTIGFEVNNNAASQMTKCATSPSHFFRVNSLNISDAFKSIASAIQQIKLIG